MSENTTLSVQTTQETLERFRRAKASYSNWEKGFVTSDQLLQYLLDLFEKEFCDGLKVK